MTHRKQLCRVLVVCIVVALTECLNKNEDQVTAVIEVAKGDQRVEQ